LKSCDCRRSRHGSESGPKTLIRTLMRVHCGDDCRIKRVRGFEFGSSVVVERCIDRDRPVYNLYQKPLKPSLRDEIKQRKRGDEVNRRAIERVFEVVI
jgi:hypothetical protein